MLYLRSWAHHFMKTIGKLLLLLSFVVVGRWSRPNAPVVVATFSELMAPAAHRASDGSRVVLVRHNEPASPQRRAVASALALF